MKKRIFFEPKNSTKLTELPDESLLLKHPELNDDRVLPGQPEYPDYLEYPEGEDIYSKDKETEIDPEKLAERPVKAENGAEEDILKKNPHQISNPIDIPGSELDDILEESGSEDEENNYYSLGSDNNDESIEEEI